jgi:hypothetical protein
MIKKTLSIILIGYSLTAFANTPPPKGMDEATFIASRLDKSVMVQFIYNDAIADGVITDAEIDYLRSKYKEEASLYQIPTESYQEILKLKKSLKNPIFDKFLKDITEKGYITHADADAIIVKYKELKQ